MSLAKHTAINVIGSVVPMLISLVTVPLYLGYIGAERYGILAVIWALLGYFGFIDLGFGRAVAHRMSRFADAEAQERSNMLWTALISTFALGWVGSVLLWLSADYALTHLVDMSAENRAEASGTVIWLLLVFPIILPASALQGALQARLRFMELNITGVIGTLCNQLIPLVIAANGHTSLQALVPAVLVGRVFTISLLFGFCRQAVPLIGWPKLDQAQLKPMMHYGGWVSIMSMLAPLLVTLDRFVIATVSGAKTVAYYTVPYELVTKLMVISGSLSNAIFPRLAAQSAQDNRYLAEHATVVLSIFMTPVVIISIMFAQPFLYLWVGSHVTEAGYGVAEIILLGIWINTLAIPHHARLLADNNPKIVVFIYLAQIPVYLLLMWIGLTYLGIMGAAIAWSIRVSFDTILLLYFAGALGKTAQQMLLPFCTVFSATLLALLLEPQEAVRWVLAAILLWLSVFKSRHFILNSLGSLYQQVAQAKP